MDDTKGQTIFLTIVGIAFVAFFALVGFIIGTFKVPNIERFEFARKTGGENIDDVIKRAIKFKMKKDKLYVYQDTKEEKRDEKSIISRMWNSNRNTF